MPGLTAASRLKPTWRAGLLCVAAVLAACDGGQPRAASPDTDAQPAVVRRGSALWVPERSPLRQALADAQVASGSVRVPVSLPAVVEADPVKLVKAVPPVTGRIVDLDKRLGEAVRAGEILFVLDSPDVAQLQSDAAKAVAALSLARRALDRQRDLDAQEIGVRRELEQAENDYEQAQSEARRSRERLRQLGLDPGSPPRRYAMRSPIAGRVVELSAARGAFWNDPNSPLMTVADLSTVWVVASAHEQQLSAVFAGEPARITFDAYPGETFNGAVRDVGALLDADTRTVKLRIPLANASGALRPGMFAKVQLDGAPRQAVLVPTSALVQSGFKTRVFRVVAPWTFEPREVRTGAQVGDRMEVQEGLAAGDRVVVRNAVLLND
jgi:cobalt-zinc-cadmium efflux system membrane fusion protein